MVDEAESESPLRQFVDRPLYVLLILFGVTGCLGIPLLFYSRGFSNGARFLWSVISILYTALLLWIFVLIMRWCWETIAPALT